MNSVTENLSRKIVIRCTLVNASQFAYAFKYGNAKIGLKVTKPENRISFHHRNTPSLAVSPMATTSENPKPSEPLPSAIQAYWLPAILFCASVFFQLVAIPRSFPPSHYDALGIKSFSSIELVNEAYQQLSSNCYFNVLVLSVNTVWCNHQNCTANSS
ncbi:hypothetical protein L1987_08399 [Smallanthus sonchifolius]|uniref:Uncharacterized protein n=1 Tax=Smallanthus sonchifolius TaxID=185202 RepID=A0ACB9JKZ3_9ASTR|nr:hypothetical protein L1987_08399 [Smallanthus sonchifolius]